MTSDPLFNDGKDPQALRTIGEVANALGIRAHVLRYWEEQFELLNPIKRSGSRRYYRPEDVALIVQIHRLVHREGYTLRGAAKAIEAQAAHSGGSLIDAPAVAAPIIADTLFEQLAGIRADLATALAAA